MTRTEFLQMIRKLVERKSSVFGEQEWLEAPWIDAEKDQQQSICDFGLRLSNLLARNNAIEEQENLSISVVGEQIGDLAVLFQALDMRHRCCPCFQLSSPTAQGTNENQRVEQLFTVLTRDRSNQLVLCIMNMGMQLACCDAFDALRKSVKHRLDPDGLVERLEIANLRDQGMRRNVALTILDAAALRMQENLHPGAIVRISWALEFAKKQLGIHEAAFTHCEELHRRLIVTEMPVATARLQGRQ